MKRDDREDSCSHLDGLNHVILAVSVDVLGHQARCSIYQAKPTIIIHFRALCHGKLLGKPSSSWPGRWFSPGWWADRSSWRYWEILSKGLSKYIKFVIAWLPASGHVSAASKNYFREKRNRYQWLYFHQKVSYLILDQISFSQKVFQYFTEILIVNCDDLV